MAVGWNDPQLNTLAFDVALHLGSLLALLIYYRREWLTMRLRLCAPTLFAPVTHPADRGLNTGSDYRIVLEKQAETIFRSPLLIACTLALMESCCGSRM